jgi:hypothetical protein
MHQNFFIIIMFRILPPKGLKMHNLAPLRKIFQWIAYPDPSYIARTFGTQALDLLNISNNFFSHSNEQNGIPVLWKSFQPSVALIFSFFLKRVMK